MIDNYIDQNIKYTKKLLDNITKDRYKELRINRYVPLIEMILKYTDVKKPLLDIGIREGALFDVLKEFGFTDLFGIDIYKKGVKLAIEKGYECIVADVMTLNLKRKFSTIIMSHVLEHCPDINKVLENISNHLEKNGILYVEVPKEKKHIDSTKEYGHYYSFFKLKDLEDLFENRKEWEMMESGKNPTGKRFKIIVRKK